MWITSWRGLYFANTNIKAVAIWWQSPPNITQPLIIIRIKRCYIKLIFLLDRHPFSIQP